MSQGIEGDKLLPLCARSLHTQGWQQKDVKRPLRRVNVSSLPEEAGRTIVHAPPDLFSVNINLQFSSSTMEP